MDNVADLTEELTAIAGVEGADVSVSDAGVTGVKVRLETDADADGVGRAVQEVMVRHGVRARLGTTPPPPPAPLVALADYPPPSEPVVGPTVEATIAGVAVTETAKGLEVSVTATDGRIASQRCRGGEEALAEAVAIAAAELFGNGAAVLVEYRREAIAETEVVTVVIDSGSGGRLAGAAVMGAGFPFAVARAVAAALGA
ncbi:MAG: hypothetical protein OES13_04475 [Acidimicrobiia bacterium]|nr:hypothetical protein [Acidimicrobiia bacterium]